MPQENLEIVRRGLDAWSRGDLEATLALMDPELEWRTTGLFPGVALVYHGHEGYTRFWRDFRALWDEIEIVPERLLDHGESVVVFGRFEARGREGIRVGREMGMLFTIRDGLAAPIKAYPSGEQALEDLGAGNPAVSQNEEIVRGIVEAWNRGDLEDLLEGLDSRIEWHVPPMLPEKTVYHGHEGVRELWRSMRESFDHLHLVVEEIVDAGDQIMGLIAVLGRGKESGVVVESPSFGWVWSLRDRKIVRVDVYPNRAEALQAVKG
jgi:ketosteroid isomerase-like protein